MPLFGGAMGSGNTPGFANRIFMVPIMLPRDVTLDRLAARLNATGTGGARFGVYNVNQTTRRATTLLGGSASAVTTTAGGNLESALSASITLLANTLYLGAIHAGDATQGWIALNNDDSYSRRLIPLKVLAEIANNPADMGLSLTYTSTFASGLPTDLTATAPTTEERSYGQNFTPALWGRVA